MTDGELLDAAAKAARIMKAPDGRYWAGDHWWWPLEDDGDAFRLAFALNMRVAVGQVDWMAGEYVGEFSEPSDVERDPLAATRRAIVCAAAKRWRESRK